MGAFGQRLRSERESRGLRLVDVALATEVCAHHLAALEHEHLRELAGDPEAESYVRTYAEYLGLDPTAVVTEFRREFEPFRPPPAEEPPAEEPPVEEPPAEEPPPQPAPQASAPPRAPLRRWAWLGVLGLGLLAAAWVAMREPPTPGSSAGKPDSAVEIPIETEPAPAPPSPPPAPVETSLAPDSVTNAPRLTVAEHGVGTGVRNRRLRGAGARFREGQRVVFLTRVVGGGAGATIDHVWLREGSEISRVTLALGGPHWRTHSRKTLFRGSAGEWSVEARDEAGNVLARSSFTCAP